MTENDIVYENGDYWVSAECRCCYTVFCNGVTCATSDSSYEKTPDGLSLASARCDYLAGRRSS